MIVDFHSHTFESDGSLSPAELAALMAERGVEWFSISDHDTLSAYGQFDVPTGVRVIRGIEINTTYRGNEVHVLGYGVEGDAEPLRRLIEHNQQHRRARVERMVNRLRAAGYTITVEAVMREARHAKSVGRPHVGKALVRSGAVPDIEYAFRHLLRGGKPGYVASDYTTPHQAIDAIRGSGGIAVLAHPGRLRDRSVIAELAEGGLQGLEAFYPTHLKEDVAEFLAAGRRYGLVATAGSDFHDRRYNPGGVGMEVEDDAIQPFLDALSA